jgi:hypothetical protein
LGRFCIHSIRFNIHSAQIYIHLNRFVDNFQGFFTYGRKRKMLPSCPQILSTKNPHPVDKDVDNL